MKNTAMLMVMLLTSVFVYSQSHQFEVGALGGINVVTPKDHLVDVTYMNNAAYGMSFQYNLMPKFCVSTGVVFYKVSYDYIDDYTYVIGTVWKKSQVNGSLNYLTVPAMAKWTFGQKTKLFVNAGAQFIMQYSGSSVRTYDNGENETQKYDRNRYDGSLIAGLGGSYPVLENFSISLEGRISGAYFDAFNSIYDSNMQLLLGLNYSFGTK